MARKSHVYSVRLHPDDEMEREAIKTIETMKRNGFNFRQIVTDWANRHAGNTPEMYAKKRGGEYYITIESLERILDVYLSRYLSGIGHTPLQAHEDDVITEIDGDLSQEEANLFNAFVQRKRGK